jgi:hypothetical protein
MTGNRCETCRELRAADKQLRAEVDRLREENAALLQGPLTEEQAAEGERVRRLMLDAATIVTLRADLARARGVVTMLLDGFVGHCCKCEAYAAGLCFGEENTMTPFCEEHAPPDHFARNEGGDDIRAAVTWLAAIGKEVGDVQR